MANIQVIKTFDLENRLSYIAKGKFRPFMEIASKNVIKDITGNIIQQIDVDGKPLKENTAQTKAIKKRALGHTLSLIWDQVLMKASTYFYKANNRSSRIFVNSDRKKIGKQLMKLGYNFYGISAVVRKVIIKRFRSFIKKGLR